MRSSCSSSSRRRDAGSPRWAGASTTSRATAPSFSPKVSGGGFLVTPRADALSSAEGVRRAPGKGIKYPQFGEVFGGVVRGRQPRSGARARAHHRCRRRGDLRRPSGCGPPRLVFDSHYSDQVEFRSCNPFFRLDGVPDYINVAGVEAHGAWSSRALCSARSPASPPRRRIRSSTGGDRDCQHRRAVPARPAAAAPAEALRHARAAYQVASRSRPMARSEWSASATIRASCSCRPWPGPTPRAGVPPTSRSIPGYTVGKLGVDVRAAEG